MPNTARGALVVVLLLQVSLAAQQAPAAVQPIRFAGTWVGTQRWTIPDPPPGSRQDQPVTLTLEVVNGKITGRMTPFLGGEDGATIVEAVIVGEELRAVAVIGRPRVGPGRRSGGPPGGTNPVKVMFVFKNDGLSLTGSADVTMGDVPWTKFGYDLSKKRSRY